MDNTDDHYIAAGSLDQSTTELFKCIKCEVEYTPFAPFSIYCPDCKTLVDQMEKRISEDDTTREMYT